MRIETQPTTAYGGPAPAGHAALTNVDVADGRDILDGWQLREFAVLHREDLAAASRQRMAQRMLDKSMRTPVAGENASRKEPKCIPAKGQDAALAMQPPQRKSLWCEMTTKCCPNAERDGTSFWEPKHTRATRRPSLGGADGWQTAPEEDEDLGSGEPASSAAAMQMLQQSLTAVHVREPPAPDVPLQPVGTSISTREFRRHHHQAEDQLEPGQAAVEAALWGMCSAFQEPLTEDVVDSVFLRAVQSIQQDSQLMETLMDGMFGSPVRLLQSTEGKLLERYVSLAIARPVSGPKRLLLQLHASSHRNSPVVNTMALDSLVDVTLGAGFSLDLIVWLRSDADVTSGTGLTTDPVRVALLQCSALAAAEAQKVKHGIVPLRTTVSESSPASSPSPTPTDDARKALQNRFEAYCVDLEREYPHLATVPVTFDQRRFVPSHQCFSAWFLPGDRTRAVCYSFIAENEDDGARWMSLLRFLIRINGARVRAEIQAHSEASAKANPERSTHGGAHALSRVFLKSQHVPAPPAMEQRRWMAHALVEKSNSDFVQEIRRKVRRESQQQISMVSAETGATLASMLTAKDSRWKHTGGDVTETAMLLQRITSARGVQQVPPSVMV